MKINTEKLWFNTDNRRTYRCVSGTDLLGFCFVSKFWGSVDNGSGHFKTSIYRSRELADLAVRDLSEERLKRGYTLIEDRSYEY